MDLIISSVTHRSGSTLLQRIFNIRRETLIWGEQDGLLTLINQIHKNLRHYSVDLENQRTDYFNHGENPNYWIACMNPEMEYVEKAIINSIKALFDTLYAQHREGHDIVGFKEVRYGEEELTLFRKCYPEAKIVLLVRHPVDVYRSLQGSGLGGAVIPFIQKWNKHADYYLKLANTDPNAYLLKYEDLVNKEPQALSLISQLGKISSDEINAVLSNKIFSSPREITEEQKMTIINQCGKVMMMYGYL